SPRAVGGADRVAGDGFGHRENPAPSREIQFTMTDSTTSVTIPVVGMSARTLAGPAAAVLEAANTTATWAVGRAAAGSVNGESPPTIVVAFWACPRRHTTPAITRYA